MFLEISRPVFVFIVIGVLFSGAHAKLPSFIKPCRRDDPNLSECVTNVIKDVQPLMQTGVLGEGLKNQKPLEPFFIESVSMGNTREFKASFKNLTIKGASNFKIDKLRMNPDEFKIDILMTYPLLHIEGDYEILLKLFGQNLDTKGRGSVKNQNSRERLQIKAQKYQKDDGKTYLKIDKPRVKYQSGKILEIKFSNQNYDQTLIDALNEFINTNSDFLLQNVFPAVENEFAKATHGYVNEILGNTPVDELFA